MGKNIARDFERIRKWKDLIYGSAGVEDLILKIEAAGGITRFPFSKRVLRELIIEFYGVSRSKFVFNRGSGADELNEKARRTFCLLVAETRWFDDFLKYMLYVCRGYLNLADNGWLDEETLAAERVRPDLELLAGVIAGRMDSPRPKRPEKISGEWLDDVPPVCLPESMVDQFSEQDGGSW